MGDLQSIGRQPPSDDALLALAHGRQGCDRRAWADAYRWLTVAERGAPLTGDDLELLALAAYMSGRDEEYLKALDRAHRAHLQGGEIRKAVRCAFWLGLRLAFRGEMGPATGWFARAQRLLDREARDCAERGWLLLPEVEGRLAAGDNDRAHDTAAAAAEIGERCADADLVACARHLQGRARVLQGRVGEGLPLLDEAMVAVVAGELSPLVTGLVYCSVIEACQQVCALSRAREWTAALARWCEAQPQMVAFTGTCRVHRAEIMQFRGAWDEALQEARRACRELGQANNRRGSAAAIYREGEVHHLRGAFAEAVECYRRASELGLEPQPGLALLRLAQGRAEAAGASIRRALATITVPLERVKLLPAAVEILLAVGDRGAAEAACQELADIAERFHAGILTGIAAQAHGAVGLARGQAEAALAALRCAWQMWQQAEAPYQAARVRVLMALACRAMGDDDGARLELEAARAAFAELGAAPDLAHADRLLHGGRTSGPHGLTAREMQVLRLVAAGKSNKAIAGELCLSEKTIDRHVSNILMKLDVPSRAAATAYAYEHQVI